VAALEVQINQMSKITLEDAKKSFEEYGFCVLSDKYTNLYTPLLVKCTKGHEFQISLEDWRKRPHCPECHKSYIDLQTKIPLKNGELRLLAIDNATHTSGWALFDGKTLIKCGKFTTRSATGVERIAEVKNWIIGLLNETQADVIYFEDIQLEDYGKSVTTFKVLSQLQGVLENLAYERKVKYKIIPPATWRSYNGVTGRYRADKKQNGQLIVSQMFNLQVGDDISDAILLARYGVSQENKILAYWGETNANNT
jgi:hypothetical protein